METILITVSVLSTLSVVAIVLSVVVILHKLKGKVDVEVINEVERGLKEDIENNYRLIEGSVGDIHNTYERKIENLEHFISKVDRRIDSRADKLVDHMGREFDVVHEKLKNNQKVLLKD